MSRTLLRIYWLKTLWAFIIIIYIYIYTEVKNAHFDFCLFPKLRGCRYETSEEMKEAVTKVIDTLTQECFHGAFQKSLEWYNKCIAAGRDYSEAD